MFGRCWDSDKKTADLIHWRDTKKVFRRFEGSIPYHHLLFRDAVRHYADNEGIKNVMVLIFPNTKKIRRRPLMKRVDLRKVHKKSKTESRTNGCCLG